MIWLVWATAPYMLTWCFLFFFSEKKKNKNDGHMPFVLSSNRWWQSIIITEKMVIYISCIVSKLQHFWELVYLYLWVHTLHKSTLPWMFSCHSLRTVPFTTNEYIPESWTSTFLIFNQNFLLFLLIPKDILSVLEMREAFFSQCDLFEALSKSRTFDLYINRADCPVSQLSWISLGWLSCRKNGKCN